MRCKMPDFQLCNPHPSAEAVKVMEYLKSIYGKHILTGQHTTQSYAPEIAHIEKFTGHKPAVLGVDFLGDSPSADPNDCDNSTRWEILVNKGSYQTAIDYFNQTGGLVTASWHWFSPCGAIGGKKSFYTEQTTFDLTVALQEGTEEHRLLIRDLDAMAHILLKFKEAKVPLLWRPLHEADGGWFWWGAKGPEAFKQLYKLMFQKFVHEYDLNNLIWVLCVAKEDWVVEPEYYDIMGADIYVPKEDRSAHGEKFDFFNHITGGSKPLALSENGPIPDPDAFIREEAPWLWYLPWWGGFVLHEEWNTFDWLKKVYDHPYPLTLDDLPNFKS